MFQVETVYVVASGRGDYVIEDMLRALRWTSQATSYTVIVDRGAGAKISDDIKAGYTILKVEDAEGIADGFVTNLGVKWCIDQQVQAKQFVLLDDQCIILQPGLDTWGLEHMQKTQVGLLGVEDRINYVDAYNKMMPFFDQWQLPHANFIPGNSTLHHAALFLSDGLVNRMYQASLLTLDGVAKWPLPYGPFISWTAQMLGFYQVAWGSMDRNMPPLYVNSTTGQRHPAPHILSPQFKLYYPSRHAAGYSEEHLRDAFKKMRGETAKQHEPIRPKVSPQQKGVTTLG